jgi:hypothetical protein
LKNNFVTTKRPNLVKRSSLLQNEFPLIRWLIDTSPFSNHLGAI